MSTTTQHVAIPGGHLKVVIDGDGPPILLVHAGIVDLRAWDALVPHLVAAGHRVIRYDLRGYGGSSTDDIEFSNRADLRAALAAAGVDRAVLVGNSIGSMICLDAILETPERAVGFVWVGGGIGGFDGDVSAEERALFERADAAEIAHDIDTQLELELQIWVDGVGQPITRTSPGLREAVREMNRPLLDPNRISGRPILLEPVANVRLGELAIPVLAVVGALDVTDVKDAAARLEEAVEGARRVVVPGVAHLVGMEAPDVLAGLIVEFIGPLGSWA